MVWTDVHEEADGGDLNKLAALIAGNPEAVNDLSVWERRGEVDGIEIVSVSVCVWKKRMILNDGDCSHLARIL